MRCCSPELDWYPTQGWGGGGVWGWWGSDSALSPEGARRGDPLSPHGGDIKTKRPEPVKLGLPLF